MVGDKLTLPGQCDVSRNGSTAQQNSATIVALQAFSYYHVFPRFSFLKACGCALLFAFPLVHLYASTL